IRAATVTGVQTCALPICYIHQRINPQNRGRRQRDEIAAILRVNALMDVAEVSRLAAQRWAVVDDFELNLAARVVNDRHWRSPVEIGRAAGRGGGDGAVRE